MAEFPEGYSEFGTALADGDFVLVNKRKTLISRFWTYIQSKMSAAAVTVGSLVTSGTVDGRDVSTDGATLDAHVASTSNPHAVTAAQAGAVAVASHAALSVVGRAANSTGDVADIAAANDGEVLRRSGTTVGFGTVSTAGIGNGQVTGEKIAQSGTLDIGAASITTTGDLTAARLKSNAGSPEGSVTAGVGAICRDTTNGYLWQKESGTGNTGWRIIGVAGTYTPTGTVVTNLDSVTPGVFRYARIGNTVFVAGTATVDPTASGAINFGLSLPFASNLATTDDLSGQANTSSLSGVCQSDTTNDRADVLVGANTSTSSYSLRISFSYRVI